MANNLGLHYFQKKIKNNNNHTGLNFENDLQNCKKKKKKRK